MFDAQLVEMLWEGGLDTLYMTIVSTILSYVFGMVMGVLLVICRKDADTVDPVLMAMYDQQNDRGLGALLHKKTLDTCFTHECKRLTSTIVSNNSKVLRVYVNAGATISDTLYTYVKHVKR